MPSTKDIDIFGPMKILIVSPNGFGKTIAAASFYKAGSIHIDDADGRMKPIKAFYPEADIHYETYTTENFDKFSKWIESIEDGANFPYKTWVVDSVTSFSTTSVVYQLTVKDLVKRTKGGLPTTSWDEINGETVLFHRMLEAAKLVHKKFNANIIWTAHPIPKNETTVTPEGVEESKRVTSLAAYGNKIPAMIPGFFDEIYNIQMEKADLSGKLRRRVYTIPKEGLPGKTIFPGILPECMDITDKPFYDVLMENLKKGKA